MNIVSKSDPQAKMRTPDSRYQCLQIRELIIFNCGFTRKLTCALLLQKKKHIGIIKTRLF